MTQGSKLLGARRRLACEDPQQCLAESNAVEIILVDDVVGTGGDQFEPPLLGELCADDDDGTVEPRAPQERDGIRCRVGRFEDVVEKNDLRLLRQNAIDRRAKCRSAAHLDGVAEHHAQCRLDAIGIGHLIIDHKDVAQRWERLAQLGHVALPGEKIPARPTTGHVVIQIEATARVNQVRRTAPFSKQQLPNTPAAATQARGGCREWRFSTCAMIADRRRGDRDGAATWASAP